MAHRRAYGGHRLAGCVLYPARSLILLSDDSAKKVPMTDASPQIVSSVEDETGTRCLDILKHPDGVFTFAEYEQSGDDWQLVGESDGEGFATEYGAYLAAARAVEWMIE